MDYQEGSLMRILMRMQDMMYETRLDKSTRIEYMTLICNCGNILISDKVYQIQLKLTANQKKWVPDEDLSREFKIETLEDIIDLIIEAINPDKEDHLVSLGFREINGQKCQISLTFQRDRKKWFK